MPHIAFQEAQAWAEQSKLNLGAELEGELEVQVVSQVFARIAKQVDTSSWVDVSTTPSIIRSIISMHYVAWIYRRTYSEETDGPTYADRLTQMADSLIAGILTGAVDIEEITEDDDSHASGYPTDTSTASDPTTDDTSLGPESFSMSTIW
jgi:uncharacterized protein (DUF1501 family)